MRRFLLLLLAVFIGVVANCQTTFFEEGNWITGNNGTERGRLESVEVSHDYVVAIIEIEALKDFKRLNVVNYDTYIVSENMYVLELFQVCCFQDDGTVTLWSVNGLGWDNVGKGERRRCMLFFAGHLPSTMTTISIIDDGDGIGHHGYCFRNYKINIERTNYLPYYTENEIKKQIDKDVGGIWKKDRLCGIYEPVGERDLPTLACVKSDGEYYLIHVLSPSNYLQRIYWEVGDIKAKLRRTASNTLIADEWYSDDNYYKTSGYVTFDDTYMFFTDNNGDEEHRYIKIYPYSSH